MSNTPTFTPRRYKILKISPEALKHLFTTGTVHYHVDGLPSDAQLCGFSHDYSDNTINLFVEHPMYYPVPEGERADYLRVTLTAIKEKSDGLV